MQFSNGNRYSRNGYGNGYNGYNGYTRPGLLR